MAAFVCVYIKCPKFSGEKLFKLAVKSLSPTDPPEKYRCLCIYILTKIFTKCFIPRCYFQITLLVQLVAPIVVASPRKVHKNTGFFLLCVYFHIGTENGNTKAKDQRLIQNLLTHLRRSVLQK